MKLEDLPEMPKSYWPVEALVARLAYAKELLSQPDNINNQFYFDLWLKDAQAFIEKLNSEGL